MTSEELFSDLCETFGEGYVIHRNRYHVQVSTNVGIYNVYLNKHGRIKHGLGGEGKMPIAKSLNKVKDLIRKIGLGSIINREEEQAARKEARSEYDLSNIAAKIEDLRDDNNGLSGIFVDAGLRGKNANICVVIVQNIECDNSYNAEVEAIQLAADLRDKLDGAVSEDCPIFSDCRGAVEKMSSDPHNVKNVRWIKRTKNGFADHLASKRWIKNNPT